VDIADTNRRPATRRRRPTAPKTHGFSADCQAPTAPVRLELRKVGPVLPERPAPTSGKSALPARGYFGYQPGPDDRRRSVAANKIIQRPESPPIALASDRHLPYAVRPTNPASRSYRQVDGIALEIVENQAMLGNRPLDRFDHCGSCGVPDVHEDVVDAGVQRRAGPGRVVAMGRVVRVDRP
jgi:hypothetical protein